MVLRALRLFVILCWAGLCEFLKRPVGSRRKSEPMKRRSRKGNAPYVYSGSLQVG
jgi:hypothetical protein